MAGSNAWWNINVDTGWLIDGVTCTAGNARVTGSDIKLENIDSDADCIISYKANAEAPSSQQTDNTGN